MSRFRYSSLRLNSVAAAAAAALSSGAWTSPRYLERAPERILAATFAGGVFWMGRHAPKNSGTEAPVRIEFVGGLSSMKGWRGVAAALHPLALSQPLCRPWNAAPHKCI
jgi:hypothetical protein